VSTHGVKEDKMGPTGRFAFKRLHSGKPKIVVGSSASAGEAAEVTLAVDSICQPCVCSDTYD